MRKWIFIGITFIIFLFSCKEQVSTTVLEPEQNAPFNLFDTINYNTGTEVNIPIDSSSFLGLHTHIFSKRCNQPACHDGTFEPDFRTVLSSYNTLVYHPIIKNYETDPLAFRVQPGEPNISMLYHRLTIDNPPNFESMPSSGIPLPDDQIQLINNWILNGAKDMFGNDPQQTSLQPTCYGVVAYEYLGNDTLRVDTIRQGQNIDPFVVSGNTDLDLWFLFIDRNINGDFVLGNELNYNKIKISTDAYDFSNAITFDLEIELLNPLFMNSIYSEPAGNDFPHYQHLVFNPSDYGFNSGDRLFIRTYVQDNDHPTPTEIPEENSPFYIQSYFSFDIL